MPLTLIVGCMFSGKTTEMLRQVDRLAAIKKKVLIVHSVVDTRIKNSRVHTHAETSRTSKQYKHIKEIPFDEYDAVAIDEGQFFPDIMDIIPYLDNTIVMISALNGTAEKKNFGKIHELMPHADDIIFKKAYCGMCVDTISPAPFTKRLAQQHGNTIDIGASDKYIAVCRKCYNLNFPM